MENDNIDDFEFVGYDFCGGSDDGYTIFMFVHRNEEDKGFTLSLRDHEGFNDHGEVYFEDGQAIPNKLKNGILEKLKNSMKEEKDNRSVCKVIELCVTGILR